MPTFRKELDQVAKEAAQTHADYEDFLLKLMELEYEARIENRKKEQIRQAGFPAKMYLHDLKRELLPEDAINKLPIVIGNFESAKFRKIRSAKIGKFQSAVLL